MDTTFTTSDMDLIMNLLILGHRPKLVEAVDGLVKYTFDLESTKIDIGRLSNNEDITVSLRAVWAANKVWSMNRSRAKGR